MIEWPLQTYGACKAPSGYKPWIEKHYHFSATYRYGGVNQDTLVSTVQWNGFVDACRKLEENWIYRADEPNKDIWGNEGVKRIWTASGWRSIFRGDCDDSAVKKLAMAMEDFGFKRSNVRLCACEKFGENHLVLLAIDPFARIHVFDNVPQPYMNYFPYSTDHFGWEFLSCEGLNKDNPYEWLRLKKKPTLLDVIEGKK